MKKVLSIVGPTAIGKTNLGIKLAQKLNGEIINSDSMQIYKKLDIGTSKPTLVQQKTVTHHLIDIKNFNESYSVFEFQKQARQIIDKISSKGKLPIVVGGSGLYMQALLYDFKLGFNGKKFNISKNHTRYSEINENFTSEEFWNLLNYKDSSIAKKIHPKDKRRIVRILDTMNHNGEKNKYNQDLKSKFYDYFMIGLCVERETLYKKINNRVENMIKSGLVFEAEMLKNFPNVQASYGIGYREFFPYFEGKVSLEEVFNNIKIHTRRYAKRQLTWLRNRMFPHWINLTNHSKESEIIVENLIENWLYKH